MRPGVRCKLRLTLPDYIKLNAIGELDDDDVKIDLSTVISARAALDYDQARWLSDEPVVQPSPSNHDVIIEYAAHPKAQLYVKTSENSWQTYDLSANSETMLVEVQPTYRPVTLRIVDKTTHNKVPIRLHLRGAHGEYLPPRGHHRKVNPFWFEDNYAEFVNVHKQYCYVDGECIVDLPLGHVYIEATRGYEISPLRTRIEVTPDTNLITLELERVLHWRKKGWVTADTHVHFLSPHTALLEGQAEDVHVVNLLASQWGEMFSNVGDFDGRTTLGAKEFGGDGEFLVRVGTKNRMQVLGHISLLGYSGAMIHPLCAGRPGCVATRPQPPARTRCRYGARSGQCYRDDDLQPAQPGAPTDQPLRHRGLISLSQPRLSGASRGGSDKMSATSLLGGVRTYAHLGNRPFTYENWMHAIRVGNTFVTVGPLGAFRVEGVSPGGQVRLPADGGTVNVIWQLNRRVCRLIRLKW